MRRQECLAQAVSLFVITCAFCGAGARPGLPGAGRPLAVRARRRGRRLGWLCLRREDHGAHWSPTCATRRRRGGRWVALRHTANAWDVACRGGYAYVARAYQSTRPPGDRREHAVRAGGGGLPRHTAERLGRGRVGRTTPMWLGRQLRRQWPLGDRRERAIRTGGGGLRRHAGRRLWCRGVRACYAYVADLWPGPAGDRRQHAVGAGGGGHRRHDERRCPDVAVSGGYAYVADGSSAGLRVIDVSVPSAPVEVGFVDTPGIAGGVAVSGDYAYVATRGVFG